MPASVLRVVNHQNFPNSQNRVYCRKTNKLYEIDPDICLKCPLYAGSIQGEGVECEYADLVSEGTFSVPVPDPVQHMMIISRDMDNGTVPKDYMTGIRAQEIE